MRKSSPAVGSWLGALIACAGCSDGVSDAPAASETAPSDTRAVDDPAALTAAYASHGIDIPPLEVQHACEGGTVYRFPVDAPSAVSTWEELRPLTDTVGRYPVVCADVTGLLADLPEFNDAPLADTLRVAADLDAREWFEARAADEPDYYGDVELGAWEDLDPQSGFTVPFDVLTGESLADVWIALVPTTRPWEVPAHLHLGGWNECPGPAAHVAVQRDWYERFGAEIVCVKGDVVEMRVARPPTDKDAALALAREQFLYSGGDLVYQGFDTLRRLAVSLVGARAWYFWWD